MVQGFGQGLLTIPNELQKIMTQIDAVIGAIDQTQLSKLAAVHDQMVGYMLAFPNGVPQNADTGNPNYVQAHQATAEVVSYFQNQQRGPAAMMAALSHSTNSRLELAMTAWPCWSASAGPGQPNFVGEVNLSAGQLSSYVSQMRSPLGAGFAVKKIMPKPSPGGAVRPPVDNVNDGPIDPPEPIGWQVVKDGSEVVWEKRDPAAYSQAQQVAANLRNQRANERLAGYIGTVDRWTQAAARSGSAAIARALDAGDAQVFMRFVNPATLLMEEPAETVQALGLTRSGNGTVYRALPMRDILLDVLTSKAMRDRHGLLVKGADKRAVNTWFEKAFFRQPSATELSALLQVVELFGNNAFFGCLAYSDEYERRYGNGLPTRLEHPQSASAPEPALRTTP